jgi:hypothetical protein
MPDGSSRLIDFGEMIEFDAFGERNGYRLRHLARYYVAPPELRMYYLIKTNERYEANLIAKINLDMTNRIKRKMPLNAQPVMSDKIDVYGIGMVMLAAEKYLKNDTDACFGALLWMSANDIRLMSLLKIRRS